MVTVRLPRSGPSGGSSDDLGQLLTFSHPCEAGGTDGKDSRVFMAPATSRFELKLDTAEVVRLTRSRRHTYTLFVRVGEAASAFLARLDDHVVRTVKANVRSWFEHQMNKNLVDEYYRRSTELGERGRVLGRFVFVSEEPPPDVVEVGSGAKLTLLLVGLQFRQQYFTCVWKLVGAKAGSGSGSGSDRQEQQQPAAAEPPSRPRSPPPPPRVAKPSFDTYRFGDAEEVADDQDGDGDEYVGPSAEDRDYMRASLVGRLVQMEQDQQTRLDDVRDMLATLYRCGGGGGDLDVIAELEDRIGERG